MDRRQFLKTSAGAAALLATARRAHAFYQTRNLQKFVAPLRKIGIGGDIPVAAPDTIPQPWWQPGVQHYTININQFTDQLHPLLPPTRLWGYHPANVLTGPATQKHLGGIIVAPKGTPVQITFKNNLPSTHILPVDTTIPGANQAQNKTAVHIHGGHVPWISDGGPHDWWTPGGLHGLSFLNNSALNPGAAVNEAEYYYPNDQSARLMWYHDHAWGLTRLNAYAGVATGYVITDLYDTALALANNLPGPLDTRTIYLVFQDKIFVDTNIAALDPTWPIIMPGSQPGDLWYAHVYEPARWALGPGGAPPNPSVIPEYFGDTMLVNGSVYPTLTVERRQYRFRILNACNARFLNPRFVYARGATFPANTEPSPNVAGPAIIQIGNEGGFLPAPVMLNGPKQPLLLVAPAERADFIVDFSLVPAGSTLILYNDAPAPFPKGDARNDYYPGNPKTPTSLPGFGPNTRTLLQVNVVARTGPAVPPITLPAKFTPTDPFMITQANAAGVPVPIVPTGTLVTGSTATIVDAAGKTVTGTFRRVTLNETFDAAGRLIQLMGTDVATNPAAKALTFGRAYMDPPTETPTPAGVTEIWEFVNLTGDTHPIHIHLVNAQILSRQPFSVKTYAGGIPNYLGQATAPDPNELGWKETVRMNPGEVIRVIMKFDLPTLPFAVPMSPRTGGHEYVYHCHILEHEEHDMMRPLVVA